jgi:hypothetical protein
MRPSAQRLAQVGIAAQFLALIRTLAEFFRLRSEQGSALTIPDIAPYVTGALMAAIGTAVAVGCYFMGRNRLAAGASGLTIAVLFAYKVWAIR